MGKKLVAIIETVQRIYRRLYKALIGDHDLWQQLLNIAILITIAGSLISAIISIALNNSVIAITAFLFSTVFTAFCLYLSLRSSDIIYSAVLFACVSNFILLPIMFFTSGGIHGGMPLWQLVGLVVCWVMIRRKIFILVYVLGLVIQCGCVIYSVIHPEFVIPFSSDVQAAVDVIQSLVLVSLIFGIIFKYQTRAYERRGMLLDMANANLNQMNENITMHSMYTLAKTIDAKDRYTNGHSKRVAKYSRMIAQRLYLSSTEIEDITNMAMLHDIGKIGVPDTIINKPSSLTSDEYDIIKNHPVIGYEILSEMPEMSHIGVGVRWHHERYDGTGYPDRLKGDEIPLPARIICVADAYDAMTSNRSYRNHMTQDKVRDEIEKGKGTQFDPKIADIMLEIMNEDSGYTLCER